MTAEAMLIGIICVQIVVIAALLALCIRLGNQRDQARALLVRATRATRAMHVALADEVAPKRPSWGQQRGQA